MVNTVSVYANCETKGENCEFSAFPFSLYLMFVLVCLMISQKLHT